MASVVHTFASVASIKHPTTSYCKEKVVFFPPSVQLGAARETTTRTVFARFTAASRVTKQLSCLSCRANLYHVASVFQDLDASVSLGLSGTTAGEFPAFSTGEGTCWTVERRLQRTKKSGMRVRASRGDMLGNNNVRFSPSPGSSTQSTEILRKNHVPLYVMLPPDTVSSTNKLNRPRALQASLRALKITGVDGVLMQVWWGSVEGEAPQKYDWSAYLAVVKMVNAAGLKLQASLCFHGGNISEGTRAISLPSWVLKTGESNPDIFYTDRAGNRNKESLSLAVDGLSLFGGRSPLQMYADLMESFRHTFSLYLGDTIVEVMVGLGPEGELKYPAFPDGPWRFPGIGEFQCYDKYMLEDLRNHALRLGKPEWGLGGPEDAGFYNYWPDETEFFRDQDGTWESPFGKFFLSWYAGALVEHGDRMLSLAGSIFQVNDPHVVVAGKLPGVHWWQKTRSHAAELTAGYYNAEGLDGYDPAVQMFAKHGALVTVPCLEMTDDEQLVEAKCSPEYLLLQIRKACAKYGVPISGENSLVRFDEGAHARIKRNVHRCSYPELPRMAAFTFMRMGESLFQSNHWRNFVNFVQTLNKDIVDGGERASLEKSIVSYTVIPVSNETSEPCRPPILPRKNTV